MDKVLLSNLIVVDDKRDQVRIGGVAVDGDVFRTLAQPTPSGVWFRTILADDTLLIEKKHDAAPEAAAVVGIDGGGLDDLSTHLSINETDAKA